MPDTEKLETLLREVRNAKLAKAARQDAANRAGAELADLLIDDQNTEDYIDLIGLIIEHDFDGSAVLQEFANACAYVWPSGSTRDIGPVFRAMLRRRWGVTKAVRKRRAQRAEKRVEPGMF